ncbi:MAG: adenine deaminase [Gemmatimonadota bacterium]
MDLAHLVAVARGGEPADLVLRNARLVDVLSPDIVAADIAVAEGAVAGIGRGYRGRESIDLRGRYVCPGFIDAHVHPESCLARPWEFARAVVPRGVTTVVADPHEIGSVAGVAGIRYLLDDAGRAPLRLFVNVPSCIPATHLATSGAAVAPDDFGSLFRDPRVLGLGEVMDFRGVVSGDRRALAAVEAARGRPVDGHAPGLGGRDLNAYVAAGIGSDHECASADEAREKLRLGMTIFVREGSAARNLAALLPLATPCTERRLCFCTDDRQPADLLDEGSIDFLVRRAVAAGVPPLAAIRMATLNPAEHFRMPDRGAVAPGRRADLVVFGDLGDARPDLVYIGGVLAARDGVPAGPAWEAGGAPPAPEVRETVRVDWSRTGFGIPAAGRRMRVIGIVPDQIITGSLVLPPRVRAGLAVADPDRDLLKIAVIERHRASGRTALGFVKGAGLKEGAIAGTVAHDHHNLIVVGADDASMATAARAVAAAGGGQAAARGETVLALLPLPIAGLMSEEPVERVRDRVRALAAAARSLGSPLRDPFMTLSFLGLEVVPALKITDLGLVDVEAQAIVPLFAESRG